MASTMIVPTKRCQVIRAEDDGNDGQQVGDGRGGSGPGLG